MNRIKPADIPVPEKDIQEAVADFLDVALPQPSVFWHTPNGGRRNIRTGAEMKRAGTKAGIPDILILFDGKLYGIELKRKRAYARKHQKEMRDDMLAAGLERWAVARSVDDVRELLHLWGLTKRLKGLGYDK